MEPTQFRTFEEFAAHIKGKSRADALRLSIDECGKMGYLRNMTPRQKLNLQAESDYDQDLAGFQLALREPVFFREYPASKHSKQMIQEAIEGLARDEKSPENH